MPLGGEANPNRFKVIFLDIGLAQAILGLDLAEWILKPKATIINRGALAEAFIGQEILAYSYPQKQGALYVTYSHNPAGHWTNQHQMTINGKRDHFAQSDLIAVGESISLPRTKEIIGKIMDAVHDWPVFALQAGLRNKKILEIARHHRFDL